MPQPRIPLIGMTGAQGIGGRGTGLFGITQGRVRLDDSFCCLPRRQHGLYPFQGGLVGRPILYHFQGLQPQ